MKIVATVASSVALSAVTVLCGLRWGLVAGGDDAGQYVMPLLPVVLVLVIGLRAPNTLPSWLVFGCGLVMDLLLQGPLGFWALIYLAALLAVRLVPIRQSRQAIQRLVWVSVICAGLAALQWTVASSYLWAGVEVWPLVWAVAVVWLTTVAAEFVAIGVGSLELRIGAARRLVRGNN